MARALTSLAQSQINNLDIKRSFTFTVAGVDVSSYLMPNWNINYSTDFGAAKAMFTLNNNDGRFSEGGTNEIKVGDRVILTEQYEGDSVTYQSFYGVVDQRSIEKRYDSRVIVLNCLDYLSLLEKMDIDLVVEGTRVEVTDEVLTPVWLDPPNQDMAQLFNFANDSIATKPIPIIRFRDKNHTSNIDRQFDGFEIYYSAGQLKLGTPLNVLYNYDVLATYSYYSVGVQVEDIIEAIIKKADSYGNYIFGESSAEAVVQNHLTTTYQDEEGAGTADTLTSAGAVNLTIETTLASAVSEGDTSITLTDSSGFPNSGVANINGDVFSWTSKTGNVLSGIPSSGGWALKAHNSGDYVKYEHTYSAGEVWYLKYSNLTTSLTTSDFTLPVGVTVVYHSARGTQDGSYIILSSAVSEAETITCNTNYSFKTIQATGIELNRMVFREREVENRFDALKKVKQFLAPNYIIRTQGDSKIWASYLRQKSTADYTLDLINEISYAEDEDLYTRVEMWAKNENPTNIMFGDDVDYSSDNEDDYTGVATDEELSYFGEEKSGLLSTWANNQLSEAILLNQTATQETIEYVQGKYINKDYPNQASTGYYVFGTVISDDRGKIILGDTIPIVKVNGVPIDNNIHQQTAVPVKVKTKKKTIVEGGGKSKSVSTTNYYYYSIIFPHTSIVPTEPIYLYDSQGLLQYTITANDPNMDYANGIWTIPGIERNDVAEILSTATYWVLYSSDKLQIEYDDVVFKIHQSILPDPQQTVVTATFEYWAIALAIRDINAVVDGRRDTQLQVEFFGAPPAGFHLATIDLGSTQDIQAIDIIGGFFKPDDIRKFDVNFSMSMRYSTDGVNFYVISDKTENFKVSGGEAITFDETDLGSDFQARYLKFVLESAERIKYGRGRYVVALTEIAVYGNIILKSNCTLIPTTQLTSSVTVGDDTIYVTSTDGFTEPESGQTATAYLDKSSAKSFTYTGLTATSFTGCVVESGISAVSGAYVTQTIETDTTVYDNDALLPQLGDRVYKKIMISDRNLFSQSRLDSIGKAYLKEFLKNHTKLSANVVFAPYLKVGQTVSLTDSFNNISNERYFVQQLTNAGDIYSLVLAKYPA